MPELTVVLPTFKERLNVQPITEALAKVLEGIDYEVMFVDDDSPDGTADLVREIAQTNPRVRVVHRVHRRGLASACIEGMMASSAPFVAVMDADMQHDERILPEMLRKIKAENLDLVAGTRNSGGGSMGEFAKERVMLSRLGRWLSNTVTRADLSDPMSGFFLLRREFLLEVVHSLSSIGFKILVDLVASAKRPVRLGEVGYTFRTRQLGESKLDVLVGAEYLQLLLDKTVGEWIPVSYIMFGLVGGAGVLVTLGLVYALMRLGGMEFDVALLTASSVAVLVNFLLNNVFTFRSFRLRGARMVGGLILFYLACGIGLVCNWQVAELMRREQWPWAAAAFAGIVVGSVWNYWVSSIVVWGVNRRRRVRRPVAA